MPNFIEQRFLENIAYGAIGGPEYRTEIVENYGGYEKRNIEWHYARSKFNVSNGVKRREQMEELIYAHRICKGAAYGFRFKDWNDFTVKSSEGILVAIEGQAGKYQLTKRYALPGATGYFDDRKILKPVNGTLTITNGIAPITPTVDYTAGVVTIASTSSATIDANVTRAITAITKATNGLVTAVGHGYITGDWVKLVGIGGMVELEGLYVQITVVSVDTFNININTSAFTTYTSGGSAIRYGITQTSPIRVRIAAHSLTAGADVTFNNVAGMTEVNGITYNVLSVTTNWVTLENSDATGYNARTTGGELNIYPDVTDYTWAGEFDVPVRFESDYMPTIYVFQNLQEVTDINLIELRQA